MHDGSAGFTQGGNSATNFACKDISYPSQGRLWLLARRTMPAFDVNQEIYN